MSRARRDPPPAGLLFEATPVPKRGMPRQNEIAPGAPASVPSPHMPRPISLAPEVGPPPGKRVVARALFLRSLYADTDSLESAVQACRQAITDEGLHAWVDRTTPGCIRVGAAGPSTST